MGERVEKGERRRELILNYITFTYSALCPSQKDAKGKRAAGYSIYFHLNMKGTGHTPPSPFQGECILISNLCPTYPVHVCTHTP